MSPMSDSEPSARPRQVTMAAGFVIGGSILLLVAAFDSITNLHSVDTRAAVAKMLASGTGDSFGISVSQVLSAMRVGLVVASLCAAVSAVLGIFALQRHRGARVLLSVLAVPILLTAPLTGGLLGALVVLATATLWSGPARDWFAGRPVRQPPVREERAPDAPSRAAAQSGPVRPPAAGPPAPPAQANPRAPSAPDVSTDRPSSQPAATPGYGVHPARQQVVPQATVATWDLPGGPPSQGPQGAGPVPAQVKLACVLTWTFAGVVALLYAGVMVALVVAQDELVDYVVSSPAWQRAKLQEDLILPVLWLGCLMFFAWCLGAMVLAVFTWRRHNWARFLLAASAGAALLAALFAFPVGLPHQVACAVTIAGLFSAGAREWFAPQGYGPPPGPPYGPPPGSMPGSTPDATSGSMPGQQPQPPQDRSGRPPVW